MSKEDAIREPGTRTPADHIWDRFWKKACEITQTLRSINDPDVRAENVRLAHRFLAASRNVRSGKTRYGPVTDYLSAYQMEKLKVQAQEQAQVKGLFAMAQANLSEDEVRPLSSAMLKGEQQAIRDGVEHFVLWESRYNTQPPLQPEKPEPGTFTLH